jgi:hypothetical protein
MNHMTADTPGILQIAYLPRGGFVLPLLSRLQGSTVPAIRALATEWSSSGLGDLACSLSTKISMLSLLAERIYTTITPMLDSVSGDKDALRAFQTGKGWIPSERDRPYKVLLEVDTFIFEFRSAYEILGKFLVLFFKVFLHRPVTEDAIKAVLKSRGVSMEWADELQAHRKIFFHEQAPWLAIRVKDWEHFSAELLILSHSGANSDDPAEVIPFDRLRAIFAGMEISLRHIQEWMMSEIEQLERES